MGEVVCSRWVCNYACWDMSLGMSGDGSICQPKGSASHCSGWMGSTCVPSVTAAAPVMVGLAV